MTYSIEEYVFGSKLYGTDNENSDTDILVIYKCPIAWKKYINTLPNFHMFQYDDCENNKQFINLFFLLLLREQNFFLSNYT